MTSSTTFQTHPVNVLSVPTEQKMIQNGISTWCSLVISGYTANAQDQGIFVTLDGTHGAGFDSLLNRLRQICEEKGISFTSDPTSNYLKPEQDLRAEMARYLTDNRAFGYKATDVLPGQYFQSGSREALNSRVSGYDNGKGIYVLYGPGASMLADREPDLRFFADFSRENQQRCHAQGMGSFGFGRSEDQVETYKNCLFLEWPVWETYRRSWLDYYAGRPDVEAFYMDLNCSEEPKWLRPSSLKELLRQTGRQPFRVKPFFAPGIWGGQYLKELCGLPEEWPNCAWSFEPIAPENTLLLGIQDTILEVPFTLLMEAAPTDILGVRNVELFGSYFPIRFDYLDTMQGGRLSLQVHPRQDYVETHFNEHMTQQESYYIMKNAPGAKVYLGLKVGVTGKDLLEAVENAHRHQDPLEVSSYVNEYDSSVGDLYLIPPGTVHCSGKDNLVLEISSTTWWFTFKIYDYLRLDKDGRPRPMNPEHARHNINDAMDTSAAAQGLIARPRLISRQGESTEELLGHREDLLFQVHRLTLYGPWTSETNGEFIMLNLVEGVRVRLIPLDGQGRVFEWGYAESFIIPASVGPYRLENLSGTPCTLIAARVNPDWEHPLLPTPQAADVEASHGFL
ncbi:class I mannose-6-phosphate isomerase [Paenibacillus sp. J22TS3]|uniref:class I mannose-6-phosphate isomerase n=1 Tax=Paenibacillus sp. J22TS3 TaxID=2807192 RepID=UPI001B15C92F|nr:class I mannose-6-phosphate isomerase [Paenibacillus sp. J22TS3]GIP23268.1 mannose-6-phosphate isomerase [Paenibacillus sp. J22TS3]